MFKTETFRKTSVGSKYGIFKLSAHWWYSIASNAASERFEKETLQIYTYSEHIQIGSNKSTTLEFIAIQLR